MSQRKVLSFSALGLAALTSLVLVATPAMAATTRVIGPDDLTDVNGLYTGDIGSGTHSFPGDGQLHLTNPDDGGSDANLRWTDGGLLSQVHTVDSAWSGSETRPGVIYDVDIDNDGSPDCELIGEAQYDAADGQADGVTHDVYLNTDASFPSDEMYICVKEAPSNDDNEMESLSASAIDGQYHGDLDDWAAHFNDYNAEENLPDCGSGYLGSDLRASFESDECVPDVARVIYTGVSTLGQPQTGALSSVDVGDNHYIFPSSADASAAQAASGSSAADVTGHFTSKQQAHRIILTLTSDATPNGLAAGKNLVWTYTVSGRSPTTVSQTAGRNDTVTVTDFHHVNRAGHHVVVRLFKNGVRVGVFVILPRPHHRHHHSG